LKNELMSVAATSTPPAAAAAAVPAAASGPRQIVLTKEAHNKYVEVRAKLETTVRTLEQVGMMMQQSKSEVRRLDVTMTVLKAEPEDAKLYKNYGLLLCLTLQLRFTRSLASGFRAHVFA
jgi:hypothetical protein